MAHYSILVTSSPYEGTHAQRAVTFVKSAIAQGHTVNNIFFYGQGVHHANGFMVEVGDEFYPIKAWQSLKNDHDITLLLCITAAVKRGVIGEQEAASAGLPAANVADGFEQAGLGEFFTALHDCDKVVQF
ncbi:sulfurtransferase complex subunit TusD [Alteromonas sp. 1_MG-2023]|uniref:sulfurtransferase complex subunit TusD n=1 Tax=Alteromonas sp. 1_MG-2023 TaxID=3062669 RepID=UPI0026E334BA|nr:sulfurtransferase complex subunit TusD [Alteromonas sp. 1_MG-2023]MDO6569052.1 sulfurtransferase complex subunit TusD [Alteromonas sp. 1_MG-2023]